MIKEYFKKDRPQILSVINNAAIKYKEIIPNNCWQEPYMTEKKLYDELTNGVRMFGYNTKGKLVGVMGIQKLNELILIRHAYVLTLFQSKGIGSKLLKHLINRNKKSRLLVGTWRKANWAIQFYEKLDFILHTKKNSSRLLQKYWEIPLKQINNSVVLERFK